MDGVTHLDYNHSIIIIPIGKTTKTLCDSRVASDLIVKDDEVECKECLIRQVNWISDLAVALDAFDEKEKASRYRMRAAALSERI